MRIADYLAERIAAQGTSHVFMVTGGGAMFLNDALGHRPDLTPVYCHHEQACAMAAEASARISGKLGVINVTTGPGGINALNGVFGAWTDSLPLLIISGQVKRETCLNSQNPSGLRQLGDQEADIVSLAKSMTKYAVQITNPEEITYHVDKAIYLATHGRPGPCWLDIPIDIQSSVIEPHSLRRFSPAEEGLGPATDQQTLLAHGNFIVDCLNKAKRPVILAGTGIRIGHALTEFHAAVRRLGIPVVTAWTHDLIASDDPLYCGRAGTIGTRAGNFVVQNADVLLILGSRMNIRQTSYNWQSLAPNAFKIQVDIDLAELSKPTFRPDHGIHCDVKPLLAELANSSAYASPSREHVEWLAWCRQRVADYPPVRQEQRVFNGKINPYHFIDRLFAHLESDDIIACANASACIIPFQAALLKAGQRMFSNSGCASMGYDLPAAIGAYYGALAARDKQRRVICLAGDGSIMMNLQELQTIAYQGLPIKIFVLDNNGYLSIRTSQSNFFKRCTGESPQTGVGFPDFVALASAFGIPASKLQGEDFELALPHILDKSGPHLCQVVLDEKQQFEPRMSSRQLDDGRIVTPSIEDMYPFLDREELARNMLKD